MKTLKLLLNWIKSFFTNQTIEMKEPNKKPKSTPKRYVSPREQREDWFMSFGYKFEPKYKKV